MSLYLSRIEEYKNGDLLFLGFNQDSTCAVAGTTKGFRVFNMNPFKETFKRDLDGGVGVVEMLFRCNILALIGGGEHPAFSKDKLILWEDSQQIPIGELAFKSEIKAVKLRKEKVVVALEKKVYIYDFEKLNNVVDFETGENPKGLVSISAVKDIVVAFPFTEKGKVQVELLMKKKTVIVPGHENGIAYLTLNLDGTLLATASDKGTLIRIWDTETGEKLQELRRGSTEALIYCVCFSHDSSYLCTSSDKGTIHLFNVSDRPNSTNDAHSIKSLSNEPPLTAVDSKDITSNNYSSTTTVVNKDPESKPENRKSKFSFLGGLISGLNSEWSFAWYENPNAAPSIVSFSLDNRAVYSISANGEVLRLEFDPVKGGECVRKSYMKWNIH